MAPTQFTTFLPFFFDHASVRFHAPQESHPGQRKVMPLLDPWPVREAPNQPVVYFIHPDEEWVFSLARQFYPTAQLEILPAEREYPPAVFVVRLEPEQVASVQSLGRRYWAGGQWNGDPNHVARAPVLDVDWPADAPLTLPLVAEWSGVLNVPTYGPYTLGVEAPGRVELVVDGKPLEGKGGANLEQLLARGNHNLRLRAGGGQDQVRLWWQPPKEEPETVPGWALYSFPASVNGLAGKYFPNSDWQARPCNALTQSSTSTFT